MGEGNTREGEGIKVSKRVTFVRGFTRTKTGLEMICRKSVCMVISGYVRLTMYK